MNFYTVASKLNKKIDAEAAFMEEHGVPDARDAAERMVMREFDRNTRLGIKLMMRFKDIAAEEGLGRQTRRYFITIRPRPDAISFDAFYDIVSAYVQRRCMHEFTLTFEQKGTTDDDLGTGFHVHIDAQMSQRSKGEVLRDTHSTFKSCTDLNAIQVDVLSTDNDVQRVHRYMIEYESNDGHKALTKDADDKWRAREGLQPVYRDNLPIKSKAGCLTIQEL